jgi:mono/diheme cytochrome c family protein
VKLLNLLSAWPATCVAVIATVACMAGAAQAATPADLLAAYTAQAKAPADAERGEKFFNMVQPGELKLSCASCHTANPTKLGRNELTEKRIKALAPSANAERFTDRAKADGWFKTNCKDTLGRECTAGEKADVLAWLISLKP